MVSVWREVVKKRLRRERCFSIYLGEASPGFVFQACSIDHSDISPVLESSTYRLVIDAESDLCPHCALTLSASPTHFSRRRAITGLIGAKLLGRLKRLGRDR